LYTDTEHPQDLYRWNYSRNEAVAEDFTTKGKSKIGLVQLNLLNGCFAKLWAMYIYGNAAQNIITNM